MKKFLMRTSLFTLIVISLITSIVFGVNLVIRNGNYFSLKQDISHIILGHSHPECAYNDSLIDNFKNLAQSGESYFYTYYKLEKIVEANPQVKSVFLEFTNNQLYALLDKWIWDEVYIAQRFPMYGSFMSVSDLQLLSSHNMSAVLNSQIINLKKNLLFLKARQTDYITEFGWGSYLYLERFKTDSLLLSQDKPFDGSSRSGLESSNISVKYLEKIVEFCKRQKINLYLIRSPLHPQYSGIENEATFQHLLQTKFAQIEFLDFKDFRLANSEFGDLEHLNYLGAKKYSRFFNMIMKEGLLQKMNKQEVIDNAIERFN